MPRPARSVEVLPPHDIAAEEYVLGAILLDPSAADACLISRLEPSDFFREHNGWILEAVYECMEMGEEPTIITVAHRMKDRLDDAGGEPYLSELMSNVLTAIGVEAHIRIIQNCSRLRKIINIAGQIAQKAYSENDPSIVLSSAVASLDQLMLSADDKLERLGVNTLEQPEGPEWGIPALDAVTMGMVPGCVTIIAGRTGEGKSMLAAQIARNAAEAGMRVMIFTMEMGNREYESRMAHALSGVRKRFSRQSAPLTQHEKGLLAEAQRTIGGWNIHSSDRAGVSVDEVLASVRSRGADVVVIDYLQLMSREGDNDAEALKSITKRLKNLAREMSCHVIVVSQMNRASLGEMRSRESMKAECIVTGEKFPLPFAESLMGGAVENDADLVVMLARHTADECVRHVEVCVVKNRNGVTGHGMMESNYETAQLTTMNINQVAHAAAGDMYKHRALLKDQGLYVGEE